MVDSEDGERSAHRRTLLDYSSVGLPTPVESTSVNQSSLYKCKGHRGMSLSLISKEDHVDNV